MKRSRHSTSRNRFRFWTLMLCDRRTVARFVRSLQSVTKKMSCQTVFAVRFLRSVFNPHGCGRYTFQPSEAQDELSQLLDRDAPQLLNITYTTTAKVSTGPYLDSQPFSEFLFEVREMLAEVPESQFIFCVFRIMLAYSAFDNSDRLPRV